MRRPLYHTAIVAPYLALLLPLTSVAAPLQTAASPRGTLLRGGAEIFPFGIYHTSWIGERYGDERTQDLLAIHDNSLGILQTSLDPTSRQSDCTLLDDAARRGIGVMAELYLPALGTLIDHMKNHPAIISWQIGDDFNVTTSKNYCPPELLKERHELALAHDPNHVTYASGGSAPVARYRSFQDYQGCVNMIGIQCYPVDNKPDFPDERMLELCFQLLKSRVSEVEGSGIVPIANLQSFSWSKKGVFPTPSESRNMLYGALAAGVKGVLYYTYYDGTPIKSHVTLNQQAPALWDEIGKQAKEISQLAPFLLKGTRRALPSNAEHVHVFLWEKDAKKILVVFNTDRNASTDLHTAIPDSAGQTLAALFADRPTGLELKGGILRGRIRPEEVHVYAVSESVQPHPLEPHPPNNHSSKSRHETPWLHRVYFDSRAGALRPRGIKPRLERHFVGILDLGHAVVDERVVQPGVNFCIPFGLSQETHGIHQFFSPLFASRKGIALKAQSLISLGVH